MDKINSYWSLFEQNGSINSYLEYKTYSNYRSNLSKTKIKNIDNKKDLNL